MGECPSFPRFVYILYLNNGGSRALYINTVAKFIQEVIVEGTMLYFPRAKMLTARNHIRNSMKYNISFMYAISSLVLWAGVFLADILPWSLTGYFLFSPSNTHFSIYQCRKKAAGE